jgi:hypothetical protein
MSLLHRLIPDSKIPSVLKGPLVFGNREQIDALNAMEADINLMETEQARIGDKEIKYFEVCISYFGEQYIKIFATDAADARKKAREEADTDYADMEIDYVNAREIKK